MVLAKRHPKEIVYSHESHKRRTFESEHIESVKDEVGVLGLLQTHLFARIPKTNKSPPGETGGH